MGIDVESARFLMGAREGGVSFRHTLSLGRQHYFVSRSETLALLRQCNKAHQYDSAGFPDTYPHFADPFWNLLNVEKMDSMDASDFEDATIVHDLNRPVPHELKNAYDAVCDVGTVEHVFDFPQAIRNCLDMVRVGGRFFTFTPANNYFGHGFYQFSPELFYRILHPDNGFEVERMVAVEYGPGRRWFDVSDPEMIRSRVNLINNYPVLLFVQALKTQTKEINAQTPQQSDYAFQWEEFKEGSGGPDNSKKAGLSERLKSFMLSRCPKLSRNLESFIVAKCDKSFQFTNPRMFQKNPKRLTDHHFKTVNTKEG